MASRELFEDWKRQQAAGGLTDIQRAARYYYLQRMCFGGRVRGRTFGAAPLSRPRINLLRMEEELSEVHLRLARVVIENLSWDKFLKTYDKSGTFFYLDPPYYKAPHYCHNMYIEDFVELASALSGLKSNFILSINDHEKMRLVFNKFIIKPVKLSYSVAKGETVKANELIISNY